MRRLFYPESVAVVGASPQPDTYGHKLVAYLVEHAPALPLYPVNPKYAEAINNLGTIYYAKRSFRRAVSQYNKALKLTPNSASIYSNLGTAQFARRKYKEASEAYQKALSLDPEVFEHRAAYGTLLQERTVAEKAKFHYEYDFGDSWGHTITVEKIIPASEQPQMMTELADVRGDAARVGPVVRRDQADLHGRLRTGWVGERFGGSRRRCEGRGGARRSAALAA